MKELNSAQPTGVVAVTVTYASRKHLLMRTLKAASREGVQAIVVVDNGSDWPVKELENCSDFAPISVVTLPTNTGSAGGFSAGMMTATEMNATHIWILDDDNVPSQGCLAKLLYKYNIEQKEDCSILAMLAYRPQHQPMLATGAPLNEINPRRSSFQGFHIFDVPRKIWRRSKIGALTPRTEMPDSVRLDYAPYSGLLLKVSDLKKIGFPRADFFLYADDSEWSYRITAAGGRILLLPDAQMEDIESSWNVEENFGSSMAALLKSHGDLRAYYATRNSTFFFQHAVPGSRILKAINRYAYLLILSALAIRLNARPRYRIVRKAITDGMNGNLGKNRNFSL